MQNSDVLDKAALDFYDKKRGLWLSWIHGQDVNSIWNQLHRLVWYYALFNITNQARALSSRANNGTIAINGDISNLIDAGFATIQATGIRALCERNPQNTTRAVISVRRLLDDIEDTLPFLTRESFVASNGRPYDPEPARARLFANLSQSGVIAYDTTGPDAWHESERLHKIFDSISDIPPTRRTRFDRVNPAIILRIKNSLSVCDDVKKYTDKFVAHFADPQNRTKLTQRQVGLTLDRISKCHRAIYRATSFVLTGIIGTNDRSPIASVQYDIVEFLDQPWVSQSDLVQLRKVWKDHVLTLDTWAKDPLKY